MRLIRSMQRAETVYGIPVFLCETVSRADGKAECGKYRGAVSGNLDRSEINESQSTFHRWDRDGDLRLFPSALCADRNPHCPKCGKEIKKQSVDEMTDQIMGLEQGTKIQLLAPVVRGKGTHVKVIRAGKTQRICPCES